MPSRTMRGHYYRLLLATILIALTSGQSYNILVFPVYTTTQNTFYDALETHLTIAENKVTFLIYEDDVKMTNNETIKNFPQETILVKSNTDFTPWRSDWELRALTQFDPSIPGPYLSWLTTRCNAILTDQSLLQRLENLKPDILMVDLLGNDICGLILGQKLKVLVIGIMPLASLTEPFSYYSGNPYPPSYLPTSTSALEFIDQSQLECWTQRLNNFYSYFKIIRFWETNYFQVAFKVACQHLPHCPSVDDLYRDLALVFYNGDVILDWTRPFFPNVIPIGGLTAHVPQLLPKDMDATARFYRSGIILVNLETSLPTEKYPTQFLQILVDSLSKFPHATFWKAKNGTVEKPPKNIFVQEEFSVQDILGHARTRMIITLCDADTVFSAIFHNVPILCIPLLEHHHSVARMIEHKSLGKRLLLDHLSTDSLTKTVQDMITNKTYQDNVRRHSQLLRERSETPSDRLIYWTGYVVRHKGATHLRPQLAAKLSIMQYFLLDILLFPILSLVVIAGLLVTSRWTLSWLSHRRSTNVSKAKSD